MKNTMGQEDSLIREYSKHYSANCSSTSAMHVDMLLSQSCTVLYINAAVTYSTIHPVGAL
jgi:hypothetical protein